MPMIVLMESAVMLQGPAPYSIHEVGREPRIIYADVSVTSKEGDQKIYAFHLEGRCIVVFHQIQLVENPKCLGEIT